MYWNQIDFNMLSEAADATQLKVDLNTMPYKASVLLQIETKQKSHIFGAGSVENSSGSGNFFKLMDPPLRLSEKDAQAGIKLILTCNRKQPMQSCLTST